MSHEAVAKVYAKALFGLAEEKNILSQVTEDFAKLVLTLRTSSDLLVALSSVTFTNVERADLAKAFAEKVGMNEYMSRFIHVLVEKNRFDAINEIYEEFRLLVDNRENVVRGTVTTVEPLSHSEIEDLSKAFSKKMEKSVILEPKLDRAILGGLVVDVQGLTFDGSLRTSIQNLKENLERQSI